MAASVALITVAELETYTGVAAGSDTARMTPIVNGVSEAIEKWCQTKFLKEPRTEYYNGYGYKFLVLKQRPVDRDAALTIVEERSVPRAYDDTALTTAQYIVDYEKAILERYGGVWPKGIETVKVTYTAGLATAVGNVPAGLKRPALMWCARDYNRSTQGGDGIESERIGPYSVKYAVEQMPEEVKELLAPYRSERL